MANSIRSRFLKLLQRTVTPSNADTGYFVSFRSDDVVFSIADHDSVYWDEVFPRAAHARSVQTYRRGGRRVRRRKLP